MNMHAARRSSGGLTFIELLIVLFIVGMGWFTLMPNLDLAGDRGDDSLNQVNALIYEARTEAVTNDIRQYVYIDFENGLVKWNGEEVSLPSAVSSGHFNEYPADEGGVEFTIYPAGFSDEVRLVLSDGLTVVLDPLAVRFGEI
ncbi:Tfp pilus assembly protein FimT/FimU [Desulfovibrio sp. JC010]|uniref:pilus assembly FimT family protein n=1 Tax=Desulfovibrio sp. JC010 TaxID=2593641 RepID=UPI0013D3E61C|nr:prepilin-type cleavage/methylation domain-containing protein [Desulfovibrio sp. JC010]NDV27138.1 prepilin-type cleavage/methylation domain-containing protein [Desulfovibrio sp. JC010]